MPVETSSSGPVPEGRDPGEYDRQRRRVLWSMPTGLYVVGTRSAGVANLMTANLVTQVSTTPKLVAIAVERGAATGALIRGSGRFSISMLARADRALVRRFVKPVVDVEFTAEGKISAMQGMPVAEVSGGVPVLITAVAWMSCRLRQTVELGSIPGEEGSHVLFIGEVVDVGEGPGGPGPGSGAVVPDRGEPMRREVLRMEDTRMNYGG
ncbi:MAG: flavin reductase family protein [Acidimicrobiales bacterium]